MPDVHPLLLGLLRGDRLEWPGPHEWPRVLREARAHGLVPILHARLQGTGAAAALAGPWWDPIRAEYFRLGARAAVLAHELGALLVTFRDGGVPCVPLRGPSLAERLYGPRAVRPSGDLDLLVRRTDLRAVRDVLRGRGYLEVDRRPGFAEAYSYTLEFYRETGPPVIVEPHWTLAYPPAASRLAMEPVWSRCVPARVLGLATLGLDVGDLLLHLGLHLVHAAGDAPLLWRYEIDRLIRQERSAIDWETFVRTAREAGVDDAVAGALASVRRLFETPIPAEVLERLRPAVAAAGAGRRVAAMPIDGRESLALFFELPGLRARLRYALAILFPSRAFMRLHYGTRGRLDLARAYVRRGCRFAADAARAVLALWRRPPGRSVSPRPAGVC